MTEPNKLGAKATGPLVAQEINQQQVSIKAWSQKILVALLCVASFYGGWKSHESSMVNQCFASGGQIVEGGKTLLCKLS
ncbi:hypothetical protein [Psychrobacter frigidicola]|uniref:hypothetical protein n=1 Tax=Psychrobacter frigidicola TaxID=45611 RepID=UPI001D1226DC|nr:hypothetical protein [Psychrobacter frigidicola]